MIFNGESSYYQSQNFGDFLETVKLLNRVTRMCGRNPDAVPASVMLGFSDQMRIAATGQKRLLYEIDGGTARQWVRGVPDWIPVHHMVKVNYDADTFAHADMLDEPVTVLTSSLSETLDAYKAAANKVNSTQTRFDSGEFAKRMESVCTKYPLDDPLDFLSDEKIKERERNAMKPNFKLRDLLLLGLPDAYLVHDTADVGFIFAGELAQLDEQGREDFADLLNAPVAGIQAGAYGPEIVLTGIDPQVMMDYDQAAADAVQARQQTAGDDPGEDENADMGMQMQ
jgi:hypothetical protein